MGVCHLKRLYAWSLYERFKREPSDEWWGMNGVKRGGVLEDRRLVPKSRLRDTFKVIK